MYGKGLIRSEWLSDNRSYKNEVVVAEIMKWRALESVIWGDQEEKRKQIGNGTGEQSHQLKQVKDVALILRHLLEEDRQCGLEGRVLVRS
jgi:hypothetical protein